MPPVDAAIFKNLLLPPFGQLLLLVTTSALLRFQHSSLQLSRIVQRHAHRLLLLLLLLFGVLVEHDVQRKRLAPTGSLARSARRCARCGGGRCDSRLGRVHPAIEALRNARRLCLRN